MSIRVVAIAFAVTLASILPVVPAQAFRYEERQIEILEDIANQFATVFSPGGPCAEDVHLTGNIHLMVEVRRQKSGLAEVAIFLTLVDVEGEGTLTGARYIATGAVRKDVVTQTLPTSIPIQTTFNFVPLGACRLPSPQLEILSLHLVLAFDAADRIALSASNLSQLCIYNVNTGSFSCYPAAF